MKLVDKAIVPDGVERRFDVEEDDSGVLSPPGPV